MAHDKIAIADVKSEKRLKRGEVIKSKNNNYYLVVNFDETDYEVIQTNPQSKYQGLLNR